MTSRLSRLTAGALAAAMLASGAPAIAGQATNTLPVEVNVWAGCSLVTRPMTFVTQNSLVNVLLDATSTITVKCTPNTNFTVDLDQGLYPNGINRRMFSASTNSYISYDVYRDAPRTGVWGTGQLRNVSANSGTGAPIDIALYGRVPLSGKVKAGDYIDTLVVTLNF